MEIFLRQTVPGRSEVGVPLFACRHDDADGFGMRLAGTSAGPFGITLGPDALTVAKAGTVLSKNLTACLRD